jgi:tRNA 2-thiouridine synthesizing protein A
MGVAGEDPDESTGGIAVDVAVDARDLRCPLPLLRAKQALRDMTAGQRLRVLATDAGSARDFQAFAELSGNRLEAASEVDGVYTYILVKT